MTALLPAPRLSAALLVVWLLLNDSVQPGHLLLGAVLALVIPLFFVPARAHSVTWNQVITGVRLLGRVGVDVVRSNFELAFRILGPESAVRPRYVWVPVTLEDPAAASILAGIVTLTPGTVSADIVDADGGPHGGYLLVHAFDVRDEATLIRQIQVRYQAPLEELFA